MDNVLYIHTILAASKEMIGQSVESIASLFDYASGNDFPNEMVFAGWAYNDDMFKIVDESVKSLASSFKYKGKINIYRFRQNNGKPHVINSVVDKHAAGHNYIMVCDHDIVYDISSHDMVNRAISVLKEQKKYTGLKPCRVSFNQTINTKHSLGAYANRAAINGEEVFWGSAAAMIGPGCDVFDKEAFIKIGGYTTNAGVFGPYHRFMSMDIYKNEMSSLLLDNCYVTHPLPCIEEYSKWKSAMIDTFGNRASNNLPSDDELASRMWASVNGAK